MDLSSYSLEPLTVESVTSPADSGSIAIVAGLGGPDAVRQVLAGLPKTLPVPVLLWQHLDAGKHDRLAQQLGKASALPVYLAAQDGLARTGAVAVMTPGLGVRTDAEGCWFQALDGGVAEAVDTALSQPASLLMVLSGADGSVVAIAAAHAASGSKVYVQSPDTCFDGTAAAALMARGMAATSAAELALLAAAHWSSPESPKPEIRAGKRPK